MCVIPDMALHVRLDQLERLKYGVVSSIQSNILSCLTFLYYLSFLVFFKIDHYCFDYVFVHAWVENRS